MMVEGERKWKEGRGRVGRGERGRKTEENEGGT